MYVGRYVNQYIKRGVHKLHKIHFLSIITLLIKTCLLRSIDGKKEENDGHLARIKMEEDSEDRFPAALDVAEQYSNTDVGKAAMESHKVVIIIITLKDMSWTWCGGGGGLSHKNEGNACCLA